MRLVPLALLAMVLAATACAAAAPDKAIDPPGGPAVGTMAAPFGLPDIDGKFTTLSSFAGKPVVLNFWAFWCDTWKDEMPYLRELATQKDELGFRIAAVSIDGSRREAFLNNCRPMPVFPVLLDGGGKVSAAYDIRRVPTVVVLDAHGRVCYVHSGYPGNDAVLSAVRRALGRSVPPAATARTGP